VLMGLDHWVWEKLEPFGVSHDDYYFSTFYKDLQAAINNPDGELQRKIANHEPVFLVPHKIYKRDLYRDGKTAGIKWLLE